MTRKHKKTKDAEAPTASAPADAKKARNKAYEAELARLQVEIANLQAWVKASGARIVILLGVIGGTVTYGLIGLFLGPILLGIFYELLMAWMKNETPGSETSAIV